jgi:hypothetical protein
VQQQFLAVQTGTMALAMILVVRANRVPISTANAGRSVRSKK